MQIENVNGIIEIDSLFVRSVEKIEVKIISYNKVAAIVIENSLVKLFKNSEPGRRIKRRGSVEACNNVIGFGSFAFNFDDKVFKSFRKVVREFVRC